MGTRGGPRERVSRTLCLVGLTLAAIGHQEFVLALRVLASEDGAPEALFPIPYLLLEGESFSIFYPVYVVVFASALWWSAVNSGDVRGGWHGAQTHSRCTRWARLGSWLLLECLLAATATLPLRRVPEVAGSFVGWWSASNETRRWTLLEASSYTFLLLPCIGLAMYLTGSILAPRRSDSDAPRP